MRCGRQSKLTLVPQPVLSRFSLSQRLALAIVPLLAAALIRALGATLHYENVTAEGTIPGNQIPGPTVFCFWHRSLLIAAHRFRHRNIAILISRSFDGELIARTVERLGFTAVRGSSSRGGSTGLRNMQRAYEAGHICAFTSDGPKGPAQIAKPGAVHLAELTGAAFLGAFALVPDRAWQLRTWDRFLIPKPFARVRISWPPHAAPTLPTVQAALDQATTMAEFKNQSNAAVEV